MSSPRAQPPNQSQSEAKRRRLRKGTHSCWECKRRKMKCVFDPLSDATTCNGCRRRGSQCVSQEFPDDFSISSDKNPKKGADAVRLQTPHAGSDNRTNNERRTSAPLNTARPSEHGRRTNHDILNPVSIIPEPSRYLAFYKSVEHRILENNILQSGTHMSVSQGMYERLSRFLYDSLPSREDIERICNASHHPSVLGHEIMTMPYTTLDQEGLETPDTLLDIPPPNSHPVLICRHMLLVATFLQHLHPDLQKDIEGLSESPRSVMERLAHLAFNLVTTNDELVGSIEGLECVMIESLYQGNIGNLRRSWLSVRRAMSIAQLMGLNRSDNHAQYKVLDPKTKYDPQVMWFRICFMDRCLCLMLGLSQGSLDRSMASDAVLVNDTPMGCLERIHCIVASQILERNESHPSWHDFSLTRTLDIELQRAAMSLPSKWWLAPNLDITMSEPQALFWDTRRLYAQVMHYNLLNQLHLPYMLCSSSGKSRNEYSRITCVNVSREMLSRFITLRSFNRIAYRCRTIDFLALMASMTLLLAHIDSHLSETENLLAHQYHSDRAMIERVQENMEEINRLNSDALSAKSADLLRRLLTIEIETANSYPHCTKRVSVQEAGTGTGLPDQNDDVAVSVHIPYFGIIKIAREGISKEITKPQSTNTTTYSPAQTQIMNRSNRIGTETPDIERQMGPSGFPGSHGILNIEATRPVDTGDNCTDLQAQLGMLSGPDTATNDIITHFTPQVENDLSDPFLQGGEYPELAATGENWALQGVDLAFFDILMRSTGNEGDEGAEWNHCPEPSLNDKS